MTDKQVFTVSALTRRIKSTLETTFGTVWVEGEVSNVRRPASGHCYFTIKDEHAQISAVLFRGSQRGVTIDLKDGVQVRALGEVTVYERGGNYQIIVRTLDDAGQGALQAAFEALKKKLHAEGLFDESRKKPIPILPQHIGVVTSATGAAIRDILQVVSRRFPNLHILIAPVKVQGETAAAEIAAAIDALNARGGLDVLIVGRGGGSLEDLWAFNEEVVARAIVRSTIPVISAVGHEIDVTISDGVADCRAPTPSAAAELVIGRKEAFEEHLLSMARRAVRALREQTLATKNQLLRLSGHDVFHEPSRLVARHRQQVSVWGVRLAHQMTAGLQAARQGVDDAELRMKHRVTLVQQGGRDRVRALTDQLRALSPLAVLERGYSVTHDAEGRVIRSVAALQKGQRVRTRVADGSFDADVIALGTRNEESSINQRGSS